MRVVFCNKYYFLNGGTERYMGNIMRRFAANGHETVPFSVAYAGSWPSPYESYFLPPPGKPGEIYLNQLHLTPASLPTLLGRAVYSFEARRRLSALLDSLGGADAAYVLNIYNYMSPSILHTLAARGVRTLMRLGDYNLLCSNYKLTRDGNPCTLCVRGDHRHAVRHRCVHGSLGASAVRALSLFVHNMLGVYRHVHAFVTPSLYLARRLLDSGMPAQRIAVLPQPADVSLAANAAVPEAQDVAKTPTIVSFGRLSEEKGLDILIAAFQEADLDARLVLVGRSYDGCGERLKGLVWERFRQRIVFVDFLPLEPLSRLVAEARLCVVPSVHPDNAPQAIVESYLNATPVLGADIGAIPELIVEGVTGETFPAGSVAQLAAKLRRLWADPERLERMGAAAREHARTRLSLDEHMASLTALMGGATPRDLGLTPDRADDEARSGTPSESSEAARPAHPD